MRVAGNDHVNSANCWIDLQFLKVVQDIEGPLPEPYHLSVGIMFRPVPGIDVSSNRGDRRNPTESDENVRATNIASVDDMRHPGKPLLSLRPQEPVGVRDDSNSQHCAVSLDPRPNVVSSTFPSADIEAYPIHNALLRRGPASLARRVKMTGGAWSKSASSSSTLMAAAPCSAGKAMKMKRLLDRPSYLPGR
jgi:hypothetical protein